MDSIISTFHIDWKIIIAQAVNFAVVFIVLYVYALKPLSKLMKERGDKIAKGIKDAKENEEILKNTEREYGEILKKAKSEAAALAQAEKKQRETEKAAEMQQTKAEVAAMIESGKKQMEAEKVKMVTEAKKDILSLAMKVTETILNKKLDNAFDEKTIQELNDMK